MEFDVCYPRLIAENLPRRVADSESIQTTCTHDRNEGVDEPLKCENN